MPRDTLPAPPLQYALVRVDPTGSSEPLLVVDREREATEFARAVPLDDGSEWRVIVHED